MYYSKRTVHTLQLGVLPIVFNTVVPNLDTVRKKVQPEERINTL